MTNATRYGAPADVRFCARCVMSNQRPSSTVERENAGQPKTTLGFNADGVCAACEYQEHIDRKIDWEQRHADLMALCDQHRSKDGSHDCIVPGSGGKDSLYAAHVLQTRYGMNPLTVTWAPMMWTDVGRRNFDRWARLWPNIVMPRDDAAHARLTALAFERLPYPFQPFVIGQRHCGARLAVETGIRLVFYGENPAQYAGPVEENYEPRMPRAYYCAPSPSVDATRIAGLTGAELMSDHGFSREQLDPYTPISSAEASRVGLNFRYLGHYLRWDPQEVYYYAQQHCGFECNDQRTEGTYSKYSSIDDKLDPLHYYCTLQMFGVGRASYDASQEIRWGKITREEGVALVKRYDQEFPARYWADMLTYMGMDDERGRALLKSARAPHLWDGDTLRWRP